MEGLSFSHLGRDVWAHLLSWLDCASIARCHRVCKAWHRRLGEEETWKAAAVKYGAAQSSMEGIRLIHSFLTAEHFFSRDALQIDEMALEMVGPHYEKSNPPFVAKQGDSLRIFDVAYYHRSHPERCFYLDAKDRLVQIGPPEGACLKLLLLIGGNGLWAGPQANRKGVEAGGHSTRSFKYFPAFPSGPYVPKPEYTLMIWVDQACKGHVRFTNWKSGRAEELAFTDLFGHAYRPLKVAAVNVEKQLLLTLASCKQMCRMVWGQGGLSFSRLPVSEKPISLNSPQFVAYEERSFLKFDTGYGDSGARTRLMPIPHAKRKAPDELEGMKRHKAEE